MNTVFGSGLNSGWIGLSPIETLVQRACEPSLGEPPYNLHIELAEYINNKKANTPREAAHACLRMVNSRNPHTCLLALSLLQSLVAQCGYPFHLQIATKEFLNELVRRFPERPPPYPGPVMSRILELINEWKETICTESRWREDMGNIKDMWRLLSYKGYRFKERRRESSAPSTSNLKSADELEAEDRRAQEAKLQELIRRGTPRDLALAQDLMKILAGAEPEKKPNYREQVLIEMNKLESKVVLMNELLDSAREAYLISPPVGDGNRKVEKMVKGDVYDQVSRILVDARPKLQKLIADAGAAVAADGGEGDSESLDTFLQINDSINAVLTRYEAFKRGDWDSAEASAVPVELGGKAAPSKSDLIDLDLDFPGNASSAPVGAGSGVGGLNDLVGLLDPSDVTSQIPAVTSQPQKGPINLAALYASSPSPSPSPGLFARQQQQPGGMGSPMGGMGTGSIALPVTPTPGSIGGGGGSLWTSSFNPPSQTQSPAPASGPPSIGGSGGSGGSSQGVGFGWGQSLRSGPMGQGQGIRNQNTIGLGLGNGNGNGNGNGPGITGLAGSTVNPTQSQPSSIVVANANGSGQRNAKDPFADLAGLF